MSLEANILPEPPILEPGRKSPTETSYCELPGQTACPVGVYEDQISPMLDGEEPFDSQKIKRIERKQRNATHCSVCIFYTQDLI